MVLLVGGFLLTFGQARKWAEVRGEVITGPDAAIPTGLKEWFRKKGWNAFYPLPLDYPRVRVEGGPKRRAMIMLVCRRADAVNSTIRHHPALKPRPHDMEIEKWLKSQGLKTVHWVTTPDPYCLENPNAEPEDGDGDEDGHMFENDNVYRGEDPANSKPSGASASASRFHNQSTRNSEPRISPTSSRSSESPNKDGDSFGTGCVLRSGRRVGSQTGMGSLSLRSRACNSKSKAKSGKGSQRKAGSSRRAIKH